MTRYFLRHPLSGVLPRKFKIAFEGCPDDHAVTSINDIGWRSRIVDGRQGFKVTVAGGTSILPVSGYVLYEFLPVEEMLNVAEAVIRVFHQYGDYKHPSRNRMKFVIRAIGWDAFKAHFEEELEGFRREGGARLPFDPAAVDARGRARLDTRCCAHIAEGGRNGGNADARPWSASGDRAAPAAGRTHISAGCGTM